MSTQRIWPQVPHPTAAGRTPCPHHGDDGLVRALGRAIIACMGAAKAGEMQPQQILHHVTALEAPLKAPGVRAIHRPSCARCTRSALPKACNVAPEALAHTSGEFSLWFLGSSTTVAGVMCHQSSK